MHNNSTLRPSKLRKQRRKILVVKLAGVLLLLIIIVFLLSWLSKILTIQIVDVEVSGNAMISKEEIIDFVKKETSGKHFMLFSKNSIFLYPKKTVKEKILNSFKKVEKVEVRSRGLKTVEVIIIERRPDFMWCFSKEEVRKRSSADSGNCYFMDKEGVVFSQSPDFSGDAYTRYYGLIDSVNPIGEVYMQGGKFKEIADLINSLKDLGIIIVEFHAESANDYKIYLKNGIKIIFDDRQSLDKTLENIQSILGEIDLRRNYSASNSSEYNIVDLRFGNKIFLKKE